MAKKQQKQSDETPQMGLADFLSAEFLTTYGKKAGFGVLALALIISLVLFFFKNKNVKQVEGTKELGLSMKYLSNNSLDSAEIALNQFLAEDHDAVSESKGYLMLGKIYYNQKKYAEALEAYQKIGLSESRYSLITSGALHGISSCYIQQQQYEKAVESLEKFLALYQKKNKNNVNEKTVQDLSPSVPNVLWKLALCFKQLKNTQKLKEICQELTEVYRGTEESVKAEKLLLLI